MRKILIAVLAVFALSGCTQLTSAIQDKVATVIKPALSVGWEKTQPVGSSVIDNALFDNNVCQSEPSINDDVYTNDALTMYNNDTYRQCSTYHDYQTDGATMTCPITAYIFTGEGAGTNVQHALAYEDGWSLAILYGDGWEISLDPAGDGLGEKTEEQIMAECEPTLAKLNKLVGGGIVRYGDYNN